MALPNTNYYLLLNTKSPSSTWLPKAGCEPKIFSQKMGKLLIDHTDFIYWNWRNVIGDFDHFNLAY
jgi:hypothetical protein